MKRLILMASLLAPVHTFADSCSGGDYIAVRYELWNRSEYTIGLKFDEAEHGDNPHDFYVEPHSNPVTVYGCSDGLFTGYETGVTLMMYGDSNVDLAYFHLKKPFAADDIFLFKDQGITSPQCSCKMGVGSHWNEMNTFDCSTYTALTNRRVKVNIICK